MKILAGAGGRGGQISKNLRARAGAGAKTENSCGRGRARGPKMKNLAGAGGCGRPQGPASPRAGARKKICENELFFWFIFKLNKKSAL